MANVQITTPGIKKSLKNYTYLQAVAEFVWNGFDAQADCVELFFIENELGGIEDLKIQDNGYGIQKNDLSKKFTPFFESEKLIDPNKKNTSSAFHGKNGVGRLTFFQFAQSAKWDTIYEHDNKKYQYQITINTNSLDKYHESEVTQTSKPVGTTVYFTGVSNEIVITEIKDFLMKEFGWFLELKSAKSFSIKVNNEELDYSKIIGDKDFITLNNSETNTTFEVKYIRWGEKLNNEYSKYYLLGSDGDEKYKKNTTLNNKGDSFYHSVFIKSNFFDDFVFIAEDNEQQENLFSNIGKNKDYKFLMKEIDNFLRRKRKPFLKAYTDKLISEFKDNKAFPTYNNLNPWDITRNNELENVVRELYQVEPKIFTRLNTEQQKTFVRFLDLIMDVGETDRLFNILNEIIDLDTSEREELADLLKNSRLSAIIKTIKLIEDRYRAIEELRNLVFNKALNANEVNHVQKFIEKHYWIFGEQYHLVTAAEPNFEEALRRYIYILSGEKVSKKIAHPNKNKQMDIFMVRQDLQNDIIKNIVVELKHPQLSLGEKELSQVKKYMEIISNQDEFNGNNMSWEFFLVGNGFDTSGYIEREILNAKHHGEMSLVYKVERYKIYVKKWSEILADFEIRHKFINEKLMIERTNLIQSNISAAGIIKNINGNTALQPSEIIIPN